MGWRSILIENKQHLQIKNANLLIRDLNDYQILIALEEIDLIIIDNIWSTITIPAINEIIKYNITLVINNKSHDPFGLFLPLSGHHRPLQNLNRQLLLSKKQKAKIWQQIVKQKITNQKLIMLELGADKNKILQMEEYAQKVLDNDRNNREAIAAKIFFQSIYGCAFIRFNDDGINRSINYGYKILASKISSAIIRHGLHPSFGFFHCSESNYFNFTYDLIEPFRPLIDWITINNIDLIDENLLNIQIRLKQIEVLNYYVLIDNKIMRVKHAIDYMLKSVVSLLRGKSEKIFLPETFIDLNRKKDHFE